MANAEIIFEPLTATINETFWDKWGRQVFNIEAEGASGEEIREQILQQLAEDGYTGDAQVEVISQDGLQDIKIILEEDVDE